MLLYVYSIACIVLRARIHRRINSIYIYISFFVSFSLSLSIYIYIYIYTHICMYIQICVYIYIYIYIYMFALRFGNWRSSVCGALRFTSAFCVDD